MWNKNERDGKIEQVKGQAQQAVGRATGSKTLTSEGIDTELAGKAQATAGTVTRKAGETIEKVGKALKR